jgi:putative FmdB family regulatory protein
MPLYDYKCPQCNKLFEGLRSYSNSSTAECPICKGKSALVMSTFNWKWYNPYTKDGEGFTSQTYPKQEYRERVKNNLSKYDKL